MMWDGKRHTSPPFSRYVEIPPLSDADLGRNAYFEMARLVRMLRSAERRGLEKRAVKLRRRFAERTGDAQ
jgi:hypothetical protein